MSKEHSHTSEPHPIAAKTHQAAGAGYYRVAVALASAAPQAVIPDTVVKAKDEKQAEEKGFKELGIVSLDRTTNSVSIGPASEMDYLKAQAKRLGVDLRSRDARKLKKDDGSDIPEEDAEHGKLTWTPPGHKLTKDYFVTDFGEVVDKKTRKEEG